MELPLKEDTEHPAHYTQGEIEVWDFIIDQKLNYLEGNVVKYICRARHKNALLPDLYKALAYLKKHIEIEENIAVAKNKNKEIVYTCQGIDSNEYCGRKAVKEHKGVKLCVRCYQILKERGEINE